jgi:hypothetical protein
MAGNISEFISSALVYVVKLFNVTIHKNIIEKNMVFMVSSPYIINDLLYYYWSHMDN